MNIFTIVFVLLAVISSQAATKSNPQAQCFYERLGVPKTASLGDITKAYRDASRVHHPDRGGRTEDAQAINEAYEILRDEALRRAYDSQRTQTHSFQGTRKHSARWYSSSASTSSGSPRADTYTARKSKPFQNDFYNDVRDFDSSGYRDFAGCKGYDYSPELRFEGLKKIHFDFWDEAIIEIGFFAACVAFIKIFRFYTNPYEVYTGIKVSKDKLFLELTKNGSNVTKYAQIPLDMIKKVIYKKMDDGSSVTLGDHKQGLLRISSKEYTNFDCDLLVRIIKQVRGDAVTFEYESSLTSAEAIKKS